MVVVRASAAKSTLDAGNIFGRATSASRTHAAHAEESRQQAGRLEVDSFEFAKKMRDERRGEREKRVVWRSRWERKKKDGLSHDWMTDRVPPVALLPTQRFSFLGPFSRGFVSRLDASLASGDTVGDDEGLL